MSKFQPEKLTVEYRDSVTATGPFVPRCYTLTHSDFTGELLLTIGTQFAWDKVNQDIRDEVLGIWTIHEGNRIHYNIYVYNDKEEHDFATAFKRHEVFRRELPLALSAIRHGDGLLFECYPTLNDAPIIVHFLSRFPQFAVLENWGTFRQFTT